MLATLILAAVPLMAQSEDSGKAAVADPADSFKQRIIAIPIVYYTPETRLAFGAGGVLTFRAGEQKAATRPTSLWMYAVYSQNRQFQTKFRPEIYSANNTYFFSGTLKFERFPQRFYGVGNETLESAEECYTPQTFVLQASVQRRLFADFYGGLDYEFERTRILETVPGGILDQGFLPGGQGSRLSGLGFSLCWDSRDNVLFPERGHYLQLCTGFFDNVLGSEYDFTRLKLDLRTYVPVLEGHVLALRTYFGATGGNPPFHHLSLLGGDSLLRGYYQGRFRDKGILVVQAEYRLPVWKRIGLVGFTGVGEVFENPGDFRFDRLKHTYGCGIRFKVDKKEGTNLRMDIAGGRDTFGIYITATESF